MEYFQAVGRRKRSTACVSLKKGKGKIRVNNKTPEEYFKRADLLKYIRVPLKAISSETQFDISARVSGGGICGQATAFSLGISRALLKFNPDFRKPLKSKKLLTRDSREKERRKCGKLKARKSPQWTKR